MDRGAWQATVHVVAFSMCMHPKSLQSYLTLCDPMDCSPPGSSAHGILQTKYWSGLPCPPPGHLPDPGMEPRSLTLAGGFFTSRASWEAHMQTHTQNYNNIKYRNLEISINICKCILGGGLNGWVICNLWMFALLIFILLFLWEWLDIACFICINSHATF